MPKLPDKRSKLIRLACADLRKMEKDPRYEVDMECWHDPDYDDDDKKICVACFAGAVMAFSLGADLNMCMHPSVYDSDTGQKLADLDHLRMGKVNWPGVPDRDMPTYAKGSEAFHAAMLKLADELEEDGQ